MSSHSRRPDRNPYAVDAMCWYVRLDRLEKRNNESANQEYMREAAARCEKLEWADCSEENLLRQVESMDVIAAR